MRSQRNYHHISTAGSYLHIIGGLVTKSCLILSIPWTVAHQVPLSMGLECVAISFSTRDLPDPRIKPRSPELQVDSLSTEPSGKPYASLEFKKILLYG